VAKALRAAGWTVTRQHFGFPYFHERTAPQLALTGGGRAFTAGTDFATLTYSGPGTADGPPRVAGTACTAEEAAPIAPGDVALARRGGCRFAVKASRAQAEGAAALVVIDAPSATTAPAGSLLRIGTGIPALIATHAAGTQLERAERVHAVVDAVSERRRSANVIAETAGGGATTVMAGAHVDTAPTSPGANANASGVAALLELARAYGGRAPKSRIRLGFWGAQEAGLYGSTRYVEQLTISARRRIAAYLNLDTIASPNPRRAVYTGTDPDLERLLRSLVGPEAEREDQALARSDHVPFREAGVPVGGLFTGVPEPWDPCYHRACDTTDNLNMDVLVDMTRVAGAALNRLSRQAK
jgi:Zn-dependent M28 family amino/carboxypeptidase